MNETVVNIYEDWKKLIRNNPDSSDDCCCRIANGSAAHLAAALSKKRTIKAFSHSGWKPFCVVKEPLNEIF